MKKHFGHRIVLLALAAFALCLTAVFARTAAAAGEDQPLYKNTSAPIEQRVADIVKRLTLEEKISLVHGDETIHTSMDTRAIPRLGIPRLNMADGPHGVRWGHSTGFPPGINAGSTWNDELMYKFGAAAAREFLGKGRNMMLGPCINIHRVPFGGRNFESYSEDPFLAGKLSAEYIKGGQSEGVIATVKHFAANNQEIERGTISVEIDERTLREIYLTNFEIAVKEGGSLSIMCSYNRINGTYACENPHVLNDILKKEWGFKGFIVSDWGAVHSTIPSALASLDIEMPDVLFMGDKLLAAVKEGKVPESVIDEKVSRILYAMMATGIYDHKQNVDGNWVDSPESRAVALDLARESIVLLKNDKKILPIDKKKIKKIAVIGPNAAVGVVGGGGSSILDPFFMTSPLEGILKDAGSDIEVKYLQGCDIAAKDEYVPIPSSYLSPGGDDAGAYGFKADYYKGTDFGGSPLLTRTEKQIDYSFGSNEPAPGLGENFSVKWSGRITFPTSGKYRLTLVNDGVSRLVINGKAKFSIYAYDRTMSKSIEMDMKAGESISVRIDYQRISGRGNIKFGWIAPGSSPLGDAAKLAKESDIAIVVVGLNKNFESEGRDKDDLELPGLQNELIQKVVAAQPNTVVVLINGTPVIMEKWLDKVPAVVEAWYVSQEGGRAVGEVLFGTVNPSGKLPTTLVKNWEQCPAYGNYPGKDGKVFYKEGVFVGYRWFDKKNIAPNFPFGHGLSYTEFKYSDLKITTVDASAKSPKVKVSLKVKNTGPAAGKEVVQLYVHDDEASVERPVRELKGYKKISLDPGETKTVEMELDSMSFRFFDMKSNQWVVEPGSFQIEAGSSSRDIRLKDKVTLK